MTLREVSAVESLVSLLEQMEDRPTTIYENQELPARRPFLIFETIPIGSRTLGLRYQAQVEGTIQITVVTQGGSAVTEAEEIASRVAEMFPAGTIYQGVRIETPPWLEKGYADGGVWRQPLKIRWRVLPE